MLVADSIFLFSKVKVILKISYEYAFKIDNSILCIKQKQFIKRDCISHSVIPIEITVHSSLSAKITLKQVTIFSKRVYQSEKKC